MTTPTPVPAGIPGIEIRSAGDIRAFLYVLWPTISTLLVTNGALTDSEASLWGGLVTAILGPVIAAIYARNLSTFRVAFYAVLGALQAIVVGYGIASNADLEIWLPLVSAIIGFATGGVAAANTKTTTNAVTSTDTAG